jgi:hypothetical protein
MEQERRALESERVLAMGVGCRFDPLLLVQIQQPEWGAGPAPQPLWYHVAAQPPNPVVVSHRVEQLYALAAAGPIPVPAPANGTNNGRLRLKDTLLGLVLRAVCEAVTRSPAFVDGHLTPRWAQALTAHYCGLVALSPVALAKYWEQQNVDAKTAGDTATSGTTKRPRNVTAMLFCVRNALRQPVPLLPPYTDLPSRQLLEAIARAVAAGLLQRSKVDQWLIDRMLLDAPRQYQIWSACDDRA